MSVSWRHLGWIVLAVGSSILLCAQAQTTPPDNQSSASTPQDQSKSVAAVVRDAKANKAAHATKVFTDDDMEAHKSPIPMLNLDGDDNSDLIIQAIQKYKESHKPEETEQVVHDWYDEYDAMLASSAREAGQYRSLRESNTVNGYDLCQQSTDWDHCEKRRQAELRGQRMDAVKIRQDMERVGRIQQGLMKVRNGMGLLRLKYPWFKVRNGNGVGSF